MSHQEAKRPDAGDPEIASKHMPSVEHDAKRAEELVALFSTTKRAGAGGARSGVFGIRPSGGKSASEFIDIMTPGKVKAPPPRFSQELAGPKYSGPNPGGNQAPKIILPRTFCVDCGEGGKAPEGGCVNISSFDRPVPELHLEAGQILVSFFCQACLEVQRVAFKDPAGNLDVVLNGNVYKKKQLDNALRMQRIRKHTSDFIRANLHNPDIFPNNDN